MYVIKFVVTCKSNMIWVKFFFRDKTDIIIDRGRGRGRGGGRGRGRGGGCRRRNN
jgi:hypothetical protein